MSARRGLGCGLLVCGLLVVSGCGGTTTAHAVTGIVTFQGKPLPEGEIVFVAEDGKASDPATVKDGKYSVQVTAGKKLVRIRAARIKPGGARDAMGTPVPEDYLPAKYNTQTTLRAEVVPGGPNVFDFPLQEK
jgi:hypothetical protein